MGVPSGGWRWYARRSGRTVRRGALRFRVWMLAEPLFVIGDVPVEE